MTAPENTINGLAILSSSPVSWSLRNGTAPVIHSFDMFPQDADVLFNLGRPVTLRMQTDDADIIVNNLYVLQVQAGDNPFIKKIVLADRRWIWSYTHILKRYNIRRNIGFKRIKAQAALELQNVVPRVWYAKWSLKDPNTDPPDGKWKAEDMIKDVISAVLKTEKRFSGLESAIIFDDKFSRDIPIENLVIDDTGDQAINRALSYLPEASIYVDYNGAVHIYNRAIGDETKAIISVLPEKVGQGHIELVKNTRVRPSAIEILFTREVELRFNFKEPASKSDTIVRGDDDKFVDNVLPIPDVTLNVGGEDLCQGTWITFTEALNSWRSPTGNITNVDYTLLQQAFVPFMDLWSAMLLNGLQAPDADWTSRISAIQQHYRRTFRLNRRWMDRIMSLKPFRMATVDQSTGQRAPAAVYSDYAILPSQRSLVKQVTGNQDLSYIINMFSYPRTADESISSNDRTAPASVEILDEDQGILHANYKIDPSRGYEEILPSNIEEEDSGVDADGRPIIAGPTGDLTQIRRSIAFNAIGVGLKIPKLTSQHKIAFIFTAVPASDKQLHTIKVSPDDVKDILGAEVADAQGPVMQVRIYPATEVARIRWIDGRDDDYEKIFGLKDGEPNLKDLVLNETEVTDISQGASLNAIAKAVAARIYASFVDRFEGTMTGTITRDVRPIGWLDDVTHTVVATGEASTQMTLPDKIPQLDLFSFLDSSTRAVILKLADPSKR